MGWASASLASTEASVEGTPVDVFFSAGSPSVV